jgi:hypothetical protein
MTECHIGGCTKVLLHISAHELSQHHYMLPASTACVLTLHVVNQSFNQSINHLFGYVVNHTCCPNLSLCLVLAGQCQDPGPADLAHPYHHQGVTAENPQAASLPTPPDLEPKHSTARHGTAQHSTANVTTITCSVHTLVVVAMSSKAVLLQPKHGNRALCQLPLACALVVRQ